MARQNSLNIADYTDQTTFDKLSEILDGVVENIQTGCVSEALKSKNGSGDPTSGSVEYKRFANAQLNDKGTARTAGKGIKVKAKPVIVNLDDDKEIIEELQMKDVKLYGIAGMAEKRKVNFHDRVKAYLDRKFFSFARTIGTAVSRGTLTDKQDIIDAVIVKAKETSSDFIDGIDAEDLALVVNGTYRKALKNKLDDLPNGTAPQNGAIGMYDSLVVYESNRLPAGVNFFVMLNESIAFPNYLTDYDLEKVQYDDAIALETFIYNGIKGLAEEAIYYDEELISLNVSSVAGEASGKTAVSVSPEVNTYNSYKYKTAASVTTPSLNDSTASGYTEWNGTDEITATTGNKILIVEVDSDGLVKGAGTATVTSKA